MQRMKNIKWYIRYFKYLIKHKYYVAKMCFSMWLYWQWIKHDLSKFNPKESWSYMNYYSLWRKDMQDGFDVAWNRHQKINKHHYQYWVLIEDNWTVKLLDMPQKYIKEMLCDWWSVWYIFSKKKDKFRYCKWFEVYSRFNKNLENYKKYMSENTINYIHKFLEERKRESRIDSWMNWWYNYFEEIYPNWT
mgnify:CR=1 FL=1